MVCPIVIETMMYLQWLITFKYEHLASIFFSSFTYLRQLISWYLLLESLTPYTLHVVLSSSLWQYQAVRWFWLYFKVASKIATFCWPSWHGKIYWSLYSADTNSPHLLSKKSVRTSCQEGSLSAFKHLLMLF